MPEDTGTPLFSSATESPADLLARVREQLNREAHRARRPTPAPGAPPEPFDFASGRGLLHGWYPPERFGDFTFRWTERRFGFEADVTDATHLRMEACLFRESGLQEMRVRLRVNDREAGTAPIRESWDPVYFTLPEGASERARFSLDAGSSWCPAGTGASPDVRELALAVRQVALVRLPALPRAPVAPAAVAPARPVFRAVRGIRRILLGRELTDRIERAEEENARLAARLAALEGALAEQARIGNEAAGRVEEAARILAREDARLREGIEEAAAQGRRELARKIEGLRDG
jgi:hypothetical protein